MAVEILNGSGVGPDGRNGRRPRLRNWLARTVQVRALKRNISVTAGFKLLEVVRQHRHRLIRLVSSVVRSRDAAEDIVHDVYVKLSRRDPASAVIGEPSNYVFRAAWNAALDHAHQQRSEWQYRDEYEAEALAQVPSDEPSPEARVDSTQRLEIMVDALNELPVSCREAFVLNKLHGVGHRDIARQLGVSISMVEKHVMRAMAHCEVRLQDAGVEDR